jgi:hypothetical protein
VLVYDATESIEGRALLAISSLYFADAWVSDVGVRFLGPFDPNVRIAIQALRYDTGIDAIHTEQADTCLSSATLFAAIALRSATHLPLDVLRARQIPAVVAVQYPMDSGLRALSGSEDPEIAFDPRLFAAHVGKVLASLTPPAGGGA